MCLQKFVQVGFKTANQIQRLKNVGLGCSYRSMPIERPLTFGSMPIERPLTFGAIQR
jgi:hypothetical protein